MACVGNKSVAGGAIMIKISRPYHESSRRICVAEMSVEDWYPVAVSEKNTYFGTNTQRCLSKYAAKFGFGISQRAGGDQ